MVEKSPKEVRAVAQFQGFKDLYGERDPGGALESLREQVGKVVEAYKVNLNPKIPERVVDGLSSGLSRVNACVEEGTLPLNTFEAVVKWLSLESGKPLRTVRRVLESKLGVTENSNSLQRQVKSIL